LQCTTSRSLDLQDGEIDASSDNRNDIIDGGVDVGTDVTVPHNAVDARIRIDATITVQDANRDEYEEYCHYDCFGGDYTCSEGVVYYWVSSPVPCDYWTGECPHHEVYTCENGCERDSYRGSYWDDDAEVDYAYAVLCGGDEDAGH
jgi:hypothetical protein